jgi:hypothetical protein
MKTPGAWLINGAMDAGSPGLNELSSLQVDFKTESVLLLYQGVCPSGGYWASIDSVQLAGDTVLIQGTYNDASSRGATLALTRPYAAAVVPKIPAGYKLVSKITTVIH